MKFLLPLLFRFTLCLSTCHLTSCATSSLVGSRTRHVGHVNAIKECRADSQHAYILWQVEKKSSMETLVADLKTRNSSLGGRAPASAQMVPLVELSGETAGLPKGQSLPCLGIWRTRSDGPDGPFAPRVRWISRDRDFCINLPAMVAEPGKIASRVPLAVAQDVLLLGAIIPASTALSIGSVMGVMGGGAPAPITPSIENWQSGGDEPVVTGNKWGDE